MTARCNEGRRVMKAMHTRRSDGNRIYRGKFIAIFQRARHALKEGRAIWDKNRNTDNRVGLYVSAIERSSRSRAHKSTLTPAARYDVGGHDSWLEILQTEPVVLRTPSRVNPFLRFCRIKLPRRRSGDFSLRSAEYRSLSNVVGNVRLVIIIVGTTMNSLGRPLYSLP